MKYKVHYEARLNRNISRTHYTKTTYKKGTLICKFTEEEFIRLTLKNVDNHFSPQITLGHGVAEYFDIEKDIDFVRVIKFANAAKTLYALQLQLNTIAETIQKIYQCVHIAMTTL